MDPTLVQQTLHMLQCALAPDTNLQRQATEALKANSSNPEFLLYLSHVFVGGVGPSAPSVVHCRDESSRRSNCCEPSHGSDP